MNFEAGSTVRYDKNCLKQSHINIGWGDLLFKISRKTGERPWGDEYEATVIKMPEDKTLEIFEMASIGKVMSLHGPSIQKAIPLEPLKYKDMV